MKCTCGMEMVLHRATEEAPYAYTMSGLKGLYLAGISFHRCPSCKEETPIIPRLGQLHNEIAKSLIKKAGPLLGSEVRFLRKNAGFQATDFAALLCMSPSHLSKAENGHLSLGPATDKLVKALAMAASEGEHIREVLLKRVTRIKREEKVFKAHKSLFKLGKNRWLQAVA